MFSYLSLTATSLPLQSLELDLEGFKLLHHFHGDPIVCSRGLKMLPRAVSPKMAPDLQEISADTVRLQPPVIREAAEAY